MTKRPGASKPQKSQQTGSCSEENVLLKSLRAHGQVAESENPDVALGSGQTHVLVKKPGKASGQLIEKRKSFFKR